MPTLMAGPRQYRFNLPITTPEQLRIFLKLAFGVEFPDVQVCPDHSTPWKAFQDAYFADDSIVIWEASRGFGGKSFMMATLGLTEALTLKADVNILGGSGEQSRRVLDAMQRLWAHPSAPLRWLASDPGTWRTHFQWGNTIQALMASQGSVRGPHPQRLRLDEVDVMSLDILDAALGQTMELRGVKPQTLLSSTHQNPDGTMTEIKKRAKQHGYRYHAWCYKETLQPHGWLLPTEVERKRREIPAGMFATEYDLQEPSFEGRAIMTESVEKMFNRDLGVFAGDLREYVELEAPIDGAVYVHGADWAKTIDMTIVVTLRVDLPVAKVVAFERTHRRPWPEMIGRLDARIERYGGGAAHDATSMGGSMAGDMLKSSVEAVVLSGAVRNELLVDYIAAVENGEIESPMIDYMYAEHKYATNDDLFGRGHLPDTISAMATAWKMAKRWRLVHSVPEGPTTVGSYWLRTQLHEDDEDDSDGDY